MGWCCLKVFLRCACGLTHLQVSELTELLELPAGELEDVRTMRMVALLKEETAQAKKEKGEAVAGMALIEADNEKLKLELEATHGTVSQLIEELHKSKNSKKKAVTKIVFKK